MEMEDVKTIFLEDKVYAVIGELQINGTEYIHFAEVENPQKFCIRKIKVINGEEMIVGLDNKEEFDMALNAFSQKHIKDLEN